MLVTFNSAMPIYKSTDWLDIIELKLEQIHFQSPVYALKLCCHKHERAENSHGDFFARKNKVFLPIVPDFCFLNQNY